MRVSIILLFPKATLKRNGFIHIGDSITKKKNRRGSDASPNCFKQNVTIAYLMCRFYGSVLNNQTEKFNSVLSYLTTIIKSLSSEGIDECMRSLVLALRAILLENGLTCISINKDCTKNLLKNCIKAFLNNKFNDLGIASKILLLLCEIIQNSELYKAYESKEFGTFLEYLPNLLLKPTINESCLDAMGRLGRHQNVVFLRALERLLPKIAEHLQTIQVVDAVNVFEGKKHIINLFYWIYPKKCFSKTELELLLNNIESNITDKRIVNYCNYVLTTA